MDIDLSAFPTKSVDKAVHILSAAGISDEQTAKALDVAGDILRERQQLWMGDSVEFEVDDTPSHQSTVFLTFLIKTNPDAASSMTFDLYERLLRLYPDHPPCLNIGFRSATLK